MDERSAVPISPNETIPLRVFNRDFIEDSVFPFGEGEAPPIFVFGTASVAKQQRVSKLKAELMRAQSTLQTEENKKQIAEKDLDDYCIIRGRTVKNGLRSSGANQYSSYNKRNYRTRSETMLVNGDYSIYQLSDKQRMAFQSQHVATPKKKIYKTSYQFPKLDSLASAVSGFLATTLTTEFIQSLRDDPALSRWVYDGLGVYHRHDRDSCPFCEQVVPGQRLDALEKHFSAQYEQLIERIESKISEISHASTCVAEFEMPDPAQLHDDLAAEYRDALAGVKQTRSTAKQFFGTLLQSLEDKKGRPFASVHINVSVPNIDYGSVRRLNSVIQQHNDACDAHEFRTEEARERLEANFVAEGLVEFQRLSAEVQEYDRSVKKITADVECVSEQVEDLERDIVEHRRPADELNDDLLRYFGHREVQLHVKDTGYTITRDGVPATNLSEGETTAIALLYFLKSLGDRRFDLTSGIVVLDDPVSSLDAHALDLAFGLIQERAGDSGQLLILTHNSTFFRLVYDWFRNLPRQRGLDIYKKPARFYEISCAMDGQQRRASIQQLDPLLE